jgi:Acyl-CoA dehydrogenases
MDECKEIAMATTTLPVTTADRKIIPGGSFLISDPTPQDCFFPEDFTEEQRQIAQTTAEFAANEIVPASDQIEAKDFTVIRRLIKEASELGLTSVDIPEEYGGLEMDKSTAAIIADNIARQGSFSVIFSAHVGIGTLPIVWYGTAEQKKSICQSLPVANSLEPTLFRNPPAAPTP